jgi:hypothetical protein
LVEPFLQVKTLLEVIESPEHDETKLRELKTANYNRLRDLLSSWLSTHSAEDAAYFVDMITSCWNVGHTVRTRVALESESAGED